MSAVRSERIADSTVACWHCGEPVRIGRRHQRPNWQTSHARCGCHGCQAVARLIDSAGLKRYYDFRDALPDRPDSQLRPG